jgi:hypothetical protein
MKTELHFLNLGSFNLNLPDRWDAHFFPKIESKVRLVKDESVVMVEHFLAPGTDASEALDSFYEDHIVDVQRNVNGAIFEEEDTDFEMLVENDGEFRRYFFFAANRYIFRFTLSGSWEPQDEDDVRAMVNGLEVNESSAQLTAEIVPAAFDFDYQSWFQVGAMYSKRGGL